MDKISLIYAKNVISRKTTVAQQHLSFFMLVENIAYDKKIDVKWAGEDGVWHTLSASFHSKVDHQKEYWLARMTVPLAADKSLPGNVCFALRYKVLEEEYWDNNQGENFHIQADSGFAAGHGRPVLNTQFRCTLAAGERIIPLTLAVDKGLEARKVTIHWTCDNWKTSQQSPCRSARNYWDTKCLSNARNPNQYGSEIWTGALRINDTFQVQYKIACEGQQHFIWDDNFGQNYTIQRPRLKVLILNLHCRQEENQDYKLSQISKAIDDLGIDIVCLQEVAELWNDGQGDWGSNTARIINEGLKTPYHLVTDWSHLGFDRYREGVAILSRHPIEKNEGRYVSNSHDPYSIHSRKVVMAQIRVPYAGLLNVFSAHLSWWNDGFPEQFDNLRHWASSFHSGQVAATLLCGDFNIKAGSKGYQHVVESNEYEDQFLSATSPHVFRTVFEAREPHWQRHLDKDHRIDYVFLRKGSKLSVTSGREVFTEQVYGKVSDHIGYLMSFIPK